VTAGDLDLESNESSGMGAKNLRAMAHMSAEAADDTVRAIRSAIRESEDVPMRRLREQCEHDRIPRDSYAALGAYMEAEERENTQLRARLVESVLLSVAPDEADRFLEYALHSSSFSIQGLGIADADQATMLRRTGIDPEALVAGMCAPFANQQATGPSATAGSGIQPDR
jgi:hypothetical protein